MLLPEIDPVTRPWATAELDQGEYEGMKRSLAAIVGCDEREGEGKYVLMGTGVIIGQVPPLGLYVATATHVVTGFVNLYLGARKANGFFGADDYHQFALDMERVDRVLKAGRIKALVEPVEFGQMQFLDVTEALVGDQKDSDCMLLRCPLTGEADLLGFTPAIMDIEHPDPTERLMMTGFARPRGFPEGGLVALPFEQAGNIGVLLQQMMDDFQHIL
jgi:hypothetical protein